MSWATGDNDPASPGIDPWSKMKAPMRLLGEDQDNARDLYASAFAASKGAGSAATPATMNAVTIDRSDLEARKYQSDLATALGTIASGGPGGTIEAAARANLAKSSANTNALAAGRANPNSLAMAMRGAGNQNAGAAASAEARIAAMRAQEMRAADAANMTVLGAMRSGDLGVASEQARLRAAANQQNSGWATSSGIANDEASLRLQGIRRSALGAQAGHDQSVWDQEMADAAVDRGDAIAGDEIERRRREREAAERGQVAEYGSKWISFGKSVSDADKTTASDARVKRDVRDASEQLRGWLEAISGGNR